MQRVAAAGAAAATVGFVADEYKAWSGPCAKSHAKHLLGNARERLVQLPQGGGRDPECRRLLLQAAKVCPEEAVLLDEVGEGLRLLGEPAAALALFVRAVRRGVWRHPLQRALLAEEDLFLPSEPFLGPAALAEMPELQRLLRYVQRRLPAYREEFLRAKRSSEFIDTRVHTACAPGERCWGPVAFPSLARWYEGHWRHHYIATQNPLEVCNDLSFPLLCSSMRNFLTSPEGRSVFMMQVAVTEVDGPSCHVPLHRSRVQERLRMMCPLSVPPNSSSVLRFPGFADRRFQAGRCWWFDESFEHEMRHKGGTRSALVFDVVHPAAEPTRRVRGKWAKRRVMPQSRLVGNWSLDL